MAKILYIEDSKFQRTQTKKMIEAAGFTVTTGENGKQGFELIDTDDFDLVITDLLMPEHDGFYLLEQAQKNNVKIPIIVASADIQKSTQEKCQELGAAAFINKPIAKDELLQKISEAIEAKKAS